jgi:PKD repeat protein
MNRPTFTIAPARVRLGDPVTLAADPARILDPPTPLWDLGNGEHLSGGTLVYTYPAVGTYDVRLTASESACGQTVVTLSQPVAVVPRDVCGNGVCEAGEAGASDEDCGAGPGLTVAIGGASSGMPEAPLAFLAIVTTNPGEAVLRYEWTFGDGGSSGEANPTHVYGADGLYVVSLVVTTNLAVVSAQRVVSIQSLPEVGESEAGTCGHPDCRWKAELKFDPITRRLVPSAHMEFLRGTSLSRGYHPVLEVRIFDPSNQMVFFELLDGYELWWFGLSPSMWVIDVDFQSFAPYGDQPAPGEWRMVLRFFQREVETSKPPQRLHTEYLSETIPGCRGGECDIDPPHVQVIDGTSQTFTLLNPDPGREYLWIDRFQSPGPYAIPPAAHLSPRTGTTTTAVSPTWVPVPTDDQCNPDIAERQAMTNSKYSLELYNPPLGVPMGRADFTVIVPWQYLKEHSVDVGEGKLAAGATRLPRLRLSPFEEAAIRCDEKWCWPDVDRLQIERIPATALYPLSLLLSSTPWRAKVMAHEERHVRFYNEPSECGYKFLTVDDLRAFLRSCAEAPPNPPELFVECRVPIENGYVATAQLRARRALEEAVAQFNRFWGLVTMVLVSPMSEWLAYQESDQLPPFHIFKWCMHEKEYGSGPFVCPELPR